MLAMEGGPADHGMVQARSVSEEDVLKNIEKLTESFIESLGKGQDPTLHLVHKKSIQFSFHFIRNCVTRPLGLIRMS